MHVPKRRTEHLSHELTLKCTVWYTSSYHSINSECLYDLKSDVKCEVCWIWSIRCDYLITQLNFISYRLLLYYSIFISHIGDYETLPTGQCYAEQIKFCDICAPTYFNCGSNPKEASFMRKVRQLHMKNSGIDRTTAENLLLSKIKALPCYPFKLYSLVETNGHYVCFGVTQKGLYLFTDAEMDRVSMPEYLVKYLWQDVRYCTLKKQKILVGIFTKMITAEIVLKVRGTGAVERAETIFQDLSRLGGYAPVPGANKPRRKDGPIWKNVKRKTRRFGQSMKIRNFKFSLENSFNNLRKRTRIETK